jgi:hypothetical protein
MIIIIIIGFKAALLCMAPISQQYGYKETVMISQSKPLNMIFKSMYQNLLGKY